mmetsp:Transcript_98198/g.174814  ORF Transcript_98198/g.174814 Transcript_98198/m.174814 type:complete len:214 (-) Transcript_98198:164-805(-)
MARMASSASAPTLAPFPAAAQPGGPWVSRRIDPTFIKKVEQPPTNEAALQAWKARRKATLQGQLGTGNRVSSVIQYPNSTRDPDNLCSRFKSHLSAEDRRILRVRVKHHMRGTPSWPDNVYEVEKVLLKSFAKNPDFCNAFYCNDDFCQKLLDQAAHAVEGAGFQDARPDQKLTMNNSYWEETFQNKTATAAAEVLKQLNDVSSTLKSSKGLA